MFVFLAYNTGQELSIDRLAQNSGIHKSTIKRYLEYLEAAFLITRVRRTDNTAKNFKREVAFKVYLTNPSMRTALYAPVRDGDNPVGALVETAVACQWLRSDLARHIRYARWKEGRTNKEVDLVCLDPTLQRHQWVCEVKWSDQAAERPKLLKSLAGLARAYQCSAVHATKTVSGRATVDDTAVVYIPCALYCYTVARTAAEAGWQTEVF